MKLGIVLSFLISTTAFASFMDPNDLRKDYYQLPKVVSNITEAEFKVLIDEVKKVYSPIVAKHGSTLNMSGDWKNETPNAYARQMFNSWQVSITGGLARRPEMNKEGLQLVLCHELGHHLGGFAFAAPAMPIPIPIPIGQAWAANEGQSDYFAAHVCSRRIWQNEKAKNAEFRKTASEQIKNICNSIHTDTDEQNLCYRTLVGGEAVANTLAALMNKPKPNFDTPDLSVVDKNFDGHPQPQCRMDTTLMGTLCLQAFDDTLIPGKKVSGGVGSVEAEQEAARVSCTQASGYELGLRPQCWFKPRL